MGDLLMLSSMLSIILPTFRFKMIIKTHTSNIQITKSANFFKKKNETQGSISHSLIMHNKLTFSFNENVINKFCNRLILYHK